MTRTILTVLVLSLALTMGATIGMSKAIAADEQGNAEFGKMFGQDVPQALIDLARENDNIMLDYYDGENVLSGAEASAIEPAAGGDEPVDEAAVLEALERVRANSDGHVIIDRVRAE